MSKNSDIVVTIVLLILLAKSQNYSSASSPASPISKAPPPDILIKDFHRMTEVMGKVDNLGQMVLHPPKLPEPAKLINPSALPDLNGMMALLGPIIENFQGQNQ